MSTTSTVDEDFFLLIKEARNEIKQKPEFLSKDWAWINDLDDEGFFIFCYLIEDYNQNTITKTEFEETVYTLVILRHKLIPSDIHQKYGISVRWQLQLLFNLYERMKQKVLSWEDCQVFIKEQLDKLPIKTNN